MRVIAILLLLAVCFEIVLTCRLGREYREYLRQSLQKRSSGNYDDDDLPPPMNLDSALRRRSFNRSRSRSRNRFDSNDGSVGSGASADGGVINGGGNARRNGRRLNSGVGGNGGGVVGGTVEEKNGGRGNSGDVAIKEERRSNNNGDGNDINGRRQNDVDDFGNDKDDVQGDRND